jgi:hypothetical protein
MERGWPSLAPVQYNLLVLLKRLADRLCDFDFRRLDLQSSNAIDRLRAVECLFLMLHGNPNFLQIICSALDRVGAGDALGLVLQLLAEDCTIPSLYNCLLGLNMLKHRRYLRLEDLIHDAPPRIFATERYQFEKPVRLSVERLIRRTRESLNKMHEQLAEARSVRGYLATDVLGRFTLKTFYDSVFPGPASNFAADLQDLVVFMTRLFKSFDGLFAPLLIAKVPLENQGQVKLFSPLAFAAEIARLRAFVERLETEFAPSARLSLVQYLKIKHGRLWAIGDENELCRLVGQTIGCLVDLGRKVHEILCPPSSAARKQFGSNLAARVPFLGSRLLTRSLLSHLTVAEALSELVTVCFSAGILFEDSILTTLLGQEKKLRTEIQSRITFLEKVLGPQRYRDLAVMFPGGRDCGEEMAGAATR